MWPVSQAYLLRGLPLNVNYAAGQILAEFFTFGFNSFFCYFFLNGSSTAEIRGLSNNELQGSVSLWAPAFPRKVACWVGGACGPCNPGGLECLRADVQEQTACVCAVYHCIHAPRARFSHLGSAKKHFIRNL